MLQKRIITNNKWTIDEISFVTLQFCAHCIRYFELNPKQSSIRGYLISHPTFSAFLGKDYRNNRKVKKCEKKKY